MHKRKSTELPDATPQLLTIPQVAIALNVGKSTVYELINNEGLPFVSVRDAKRVPMGLLQWWIAQRAQSHALAVDDLLKQIASAITAQIAPPTEHRQQRSILKKKGK